MADVKISGLPTSTVPLAGTEVLPIVQGGVTKQVSVDNLTVKNVRSNATTGILQVVGPAAASTRVMTTPDADFTVARTDAGQTFTGDQEITKNDANPQLKLTRTGTFAGFGTISANQFTSIDVSGQTNASQFYINQSAATSALEITSSSDIKAGSGNFVVGTSGKGIDFSADGQAAGMTSELLDDYEEGTWTPSVSGAAITVFTANYTKVGREITLFFDVAWPSTADVTNVDISGLPFSSIANNGIMSVGFTTYTNLINGYIPSSTIRLYGAGGNPSTRLTNANLSSFRVIASVIYITT